MIRGTYTSHWRNKQKILSTQVPVFLLFRIHLTPNKKVTDSHRENARFMSRKWIVAKLKLKLSCVCVCVNTSLGSLLIKLEATTEIFPPSTYDEVRSQFFCCLTRDKKKRIFPKKREKIMRGAYTLQFVCIVLSLRCFDARRAKKMFECVMVLNVLILNNAVNRY